MIAKKADFLPLVHLNPKGEDFFNLLDVIFKLQATETKKRLNLYEPEAAQAWIDAFKARYGAEKKADVPESGTTTADLQVRDQFFFCCCVESLLEVKSFVATTARTGKMACSEIELVLENYLQQN